MSGHPPHLLHRGALGEQRHQTRVRSQVVQEHHGCAGVPIAGCLDDRRDVDEHVVAGMQEAGKQAHLLGSGGHCLVDRIGDARFGQLQVGRGDRHRSTLAHSCHQLLMSDLRGGVAAAVSDQDRDCLVGRCCGHGATVGCGDVSDNAPKHLAAGMPPPDEPEVGVGPHPLPWPEDPRLDPDLLAGGDRRNVVDRFRYWRVESIAEALQSTRFDYHVAIENWRHDLNIGTVVRNANAFGASAVHIVGRRRWNRRGAMVTDRYLDLRHHESVAELLEWAATQELEVVGIDNLPGSTPLESEPLPRRCVLLFGQEGPGLSSEAHHRCDQIRSITMYGSTRSINAGVASGIAMHAWLSRHAPR